MARRGAALVVAALALVGVAAPAVGQEEQPPRTVVSLVFDDAWANQMKAAELLTQRGMAATFYIPSGAIERPGFMTRDQLRQLEATGHEVAGHTLSHKALTTLPIEAAKVEVCSDRAALAGLGLTVTNFAYPFGDFDTEVARVVRECGYNSARLAAGLNAGGPSCSRCPVTESLPLTADRWMIRTPGTSYRRGSELNHLKSLVVRAEAEGGWLPLVFHEICTDECDADATSRSDFTAFVSWLGNRPATTSVQTVRQVVGGSVNPVVGTPPAGLFAGPASDSASPRESLSDATAFSVMGYGVGQLQVILGGILIAVCAIATYRFSTRKQRSTWKRVS